jgi:hypothetical protein
MACGELDGVPYLQLCENRPYETLNPGRSSADPGDRGHRGTTSRNLERGGDLL